MGQRLVCNIYQNEEQIASIYYHWSAYSISALEEARDIANCIMDENNPIDDIRLRLIRFCEQNGGVIDGGKNSDEFTKIQKMYPNESFKEDGSRNYGLIALTEEGRADMNHWAEGIVDIYIDDEEIFNCVYCVSSIKEYEENYLDDYGELPKINAIPILNDDIGSIHFSDINNVINKLRNLNEYVFRNEYGEVFELIA